MVPTGLFTLAVTHVIEHLLHVVPVPGGEQDRQLFYGEWRLGWEYDCVKGHMTRVTEVLSRWSHVVGR